MDATQLQRCCIKILIDEDKIGSGAMVSNDGYFLTAYHNVMDPKGNPRHIREVSQIGSAGTVNHYLTQDNPVYVVRMDERQDIALAKLDLKGQVAADWCEANIKYQPKEQDEVQIISYDAGDLDRPTLYQKRILQTNTIDIRLEGPGYPGMSGSPVFFQGKVIGIVKQTCKNDTQIVATPLWHFPEFAIIPWQWNCFAKKIDDLESFTNWDEAAQKYKSKLAALYGTMRILGKPEPVLLEGIFTDVYILDKPSAFRRYELEQLREDPEKLENAERKNGLSLVKDPQNKRLFILGKPGAGKTTFLKYLTIQAAQGNLPQIPIFVSLKEWVDSLAEDDWKKANPDLMKFLVKQFEICDFPQAEPFIRHILKQGDALVLFDGLDEVNQEGDKRRKIITALQDFSKQYLKTPCVLTCRIAATDYSFDLFTYVEVADFTEKQIRTFVSKWFVQEPKILEMFWQEFGKPEYRGIQELAKSPLLLSLLCLVFEANLYFPKRRVKIYQDALETLLKKWNVSKGIVPDETYKNLDDDYKKKLLGEVAAKTFDQEKYFLPQEEVIQYIEKFFAKLPCGSSPIKGEAVLKAIESQHGILVERAYQIYSFSHLTFQEYLTAQYIVGHALQGTLPRLLKIENILAPRWREVILMTASLLEDAEDFFTEFQKALDALASKDLPVVQLFEWCDRKAQVDSQGTQIVEKRLLYALVAMQLAYSNMLIQFFARARARALALDLDRALDRARDLDLDLDRVVDRRVAVGRAAVAGERGAAAAGDGTAEHGQAGHEASPFRSRPVAHRRPE